MNKKLLITAICLLFVAVFAIVPTACANASTATTEQVESSKSKETLLMSETGEILYGHNYNEKRPIASMTKIMTLLCIYDSIDEGKIKLTDTVQVSANAASMGGSQIFLDANTKHKVDNLIKSIVVCSANDSCVAMAEHISGSVSAFVDKMNAKAKELNLVATHFNNCTGLPCADHYSCARDVANMMMELTKHPHYFQCAKIWTEDYQHPDGRVTGMTNTNKLIHFYDGCDGGKTGFTSEAMHCLCATAKRGDTRFFAVVIGAPDSKTRFAEVSSLFNYGFANYETKVFLAKDDITTEVEVVGGKSNTVCAVPQQQIAICCPKGQTEDYNLVIDSTPVKAPLVCGTVVGKATLYNAEGKAVASTQLIASSDVAAKSYFDYVDEIILGK